MTQLPSLERWALLPFLGFPALTCFLFFFVIFRNLYHIFVASVGTSRGLIYFIFIFLYLILGQLVTTEIRFFAFKRKKEKVLDRGQNGCEDKNNKV